ncbi:hypothetical protein [Syntrophomonas palmitatica]|uniref:hypothetical protein n=1 Tax=Syntrophomonas palmitatica TaxID=402877 RepID=UPI0006CFFC12|nr:hypothetical protein [Syntrophomonas palmitatica]
MERSKRIIVSSDASGAFHAAREGFLVVVVDVIDMSTTLESALDSGAYAVLGASPDFTRAPVNVAPEKIGREAAQLAREAGSGIIVISEPRVGKDNERLARCQKLIRGIEQEKGFVEAVLPNLGAETPRLLEMKGRVVVAVTDTGGVAYDAAYTAGGRVTTGTIARTLKHKGTQPAQIAARRAQELLRDDDPGIAVIAASSNSLEDVLAAQYIANLLLPS